MNRNYINRYLYDIVFDPVFGRQMRFITGPRQCGKTTIARQKLGMEKSADFYFNWDSQEVKNLYRNNPSLLPKTGLKNKKWVCFDEIHKMPRWKNILKGIFDTREDEYNFIITGSARLDAFRKSGDSLAGRYLQFRLNPVILPELNGVKYEAITPEKNPEDFVRKAADSKRESRGSLELLLQHGGFPEPLLNGNAKFTKMWNDSYFDRVIREDMRDLSAVHYLEKVVDLIKLLPGRVGSALSVDTLAQDLELNFRTVKNYISHLSLNYLIFELPPYTGNMKRMNKKAKKAYFYNYSVIEDEAAAFENFMAVELKARVELWNCEGGEYGLYYIKNRGGSETDFLITSGKKPYLLVEAKLSGNKMDAHHMRFAEALGGIPVVQAVKKSGVLRVTEDKYFIMSADRFFA